MTRMGRWLTVAILVLGGVASLPAAEGPASVKMTDFIAPEFFAASVVHPSRLAQSRAGTLMWSRQSLQAKPGEGLAVLDQIPAAKIRRLVGLVSVTGLGTIWQFEEDLDFAKLLREASIQAEPVTIAGKTCLKLPAASNPVPMVAYVASARLLVLATEPVLKKMLGTNNEPRPLLEQLRQADLKHDIVVEVQAAPLTEKFGEIVKQLQGAAGPPNGPPPAGAGAPPPNGAGGPPSMVGAQVASAAFMVLPILQEIHTLSLQLDFQGPALFQATFVGAKPESPDKLMAFFTPMQQQLQAMVASMPPTQKEQASGQLTAAVMQSLEITKQGNRVVLRSSMPAKFAELFPKAIAEGPPGMPGAAPGSPPGAPLAK